MDNFPLKKMMIAVGIGFLVSLVCLVVISAGIYTGKVPEVYMAARGVMVLGAFIGGLLSASWASKNKLLTALASGIIFYVILVLINAILNQSWDSKTAEICFLLVLAGAVLGGVPGTLTKQKNKNRKKRRSLK